MIWHTFVIKKGRHYSLPPHFKLRIFKKQKSYKALFEENCWWDHPRNDDDFDINKLCGFSFGYHHKNSVRIGWVPDFKNKNQIEVYAYWYNNGGKFSSAYICNVNVEEWFDIKIKVDGERVYFVVNGKEFIANFLLKKFCIGYYLYPYFGGNNTAPNTMRIKLK